MASLQALEVALHVLIASRKRMIGRVLEESLSVLVHRKEVVALPRLLHSVLDGRALCLDFFADHLFSY